MISDSKGRRKFLAQTTVAGSFLALPALGKDVNVKSTVRENYGDHSVLFLTSLDEIDQYSGGLYQGQIIVVKGSLFEWQDSSILAMGPVNVKSFGAVGDGEADDTKAILRAVDLANRCQKEVYFPTGQYLCAERITVQSGALGDGADNTLIKAQNRSAQEYNFFHIIGSGVYEGFTVDGAVSRDPDLWTSENYNNFTGWGAIGIYSDDVIIKNCVGRNSWGANLRCELSSRVKIDNCVSMRSRGEMGDGFYIQRSHQVMLRNCLALDHTRIGFVCEGGTSSHGFEEISDNICFVGCQAIQGHDQGVNYGGNEFNAGFWFENSSQVSCSNCCALDQEEVGFKCVGTSRALSDDVARVTVQFSFSDCYAKNTKRGFQGSGPDSVSRGHLTFTGCVSHGNDQGYVCQRVNACLTNCSYYHYGGGSQSRAVSTGREAVVIINQFYECWKDKPASVYDPTLDAGSVSTFSRDAPSSIVVREYRTHDESPAIIKYRVAGDIPIKLLIENTIFSSPRLMAHCTLSHVKLHGAGSILKINVNDSDLVDLGGPVFEISANNCHFSRTDNAIPLLQVQSRHSNSSPLFFMVNCRFMGDLGQGGEFIIVNSETEVAAIPRAHDIYLVGCFFYNTGSESGRPIIEIKRSPGVSKVIASGVWKSRNILMMTRSSDQLVGDVNDLP